MPLAYVALPIALGLVTAVAITVIVVEVLPRLAEERERTKEKKRRVRAKPVAGQSGNGNKVEERCYSTAGSDGKDWGYEIRKRRHRKSEQVEDEPIETERHELAPQHILANPSDFELSSPDIERSRRPISSTTTTTLISIDDSESTMTPSMTTPPLVSPPLVPTSSDPFDASPFFDYERESSTPQGASSSTLRPRAPPSRVPHNDKDQRQTSSSQNPSTTNSSTFSSPLIVDHSSLSLNGSPSFSDDLEMFGKPGDGVVQQTREEGEVEEDEKRGRSETFKTESVSSEGYGDWSRLSDDDDEEDGRVGGELSVANEETRSATDEWERIEEDRKGFGLGLGGKL
ncbi:hypothetical protein JCM3765_006330 [Sporobolomyces pararoseus]